MAIQGQGYRKLTDNEIDSLYNGELKFIIWLLVIGTIVFCLYHLFTYEDNYDNASFNYTDKEITCDTDKVVIKNGVLNVKCADGTTYGVKVSK